MSAGANSRSCESRGRGQGRTVEFRKEKDSGLAGVAAIQVIKGIMGLKFQAINPTDDHPYFLQSERYRLAGDEKNRAIVLTFHHPGITDKRFVSVLKSIGIDLQTIIENGEISWYNCMIVSEAIDDNLARISQRESEEKTWKKVSKEWRFSGGMRVI
jgi:hypothetical protein